MLKRFLKILMIVAIAIVILINVFLGIWVFFQLAFRDSGRDSTVIITSVVDDSTVIEQGRHYTAEDFFDLQGVSDDARINVIANWNDVSEDARRNGIVADDDLSGFVIENGDGQLAVLVEVANPGERYTSARVCVTVN